MSTDLLVQLGGSSNTNFNLCLSFVVFVNLDYAIIYKRKNYKKPYAFVYKKQTLSHHVKTAIPNIPMVY